MSNLKQKENFLMQKNKMTMILSSVAFCLVSFVFTILLYQTLNPQVVETNNYYNERLQPYKESNDPFIKSVNVCLNLKKSEIWTYKDRENAFDYIERSCFVSLDPMSKKSQLFDTLHKESMDLVKNGDSHSE